MTFTENDALRAAIKVGATSPCQKSKRGVVLFTRQYGVCSEGRNHPLLDPCDGSAKCRARCSMQCVHAEQDAMLTSTLYAYDGHDDYPDTPIELLHVKVVNGEAVTSGPPSCPQCSKLILRSERIRKIWLLHKDGLRGYDPVEFHRLSLLNAKDDAGELLARINKAISASELGSASDAIQDMLDELDPDGSLRDGPPSVAAYSQERVGEHDDR